MYNVTRQPLVQLTAWSYSRYNDYEKCPLLCKLKHVEKRKEPENEAMARGSAVHGMVEQFLTKKVKILPSDLGKFKGQFSPMRRAKVLCEQEWAFDNKWRRVDWFSKDAWLRMKVDIHYVVKLLTKKAVRIIDIKTGKPHDEHVQQRELYAIGALLIYPEIDGVQVAHWYLDSGNKYGELYLRKQLEDLKKSWLKRTKAMLADTRFAPRPGNYCRWCHFRASNGGPCVY